MTAAAHRGPGTHARRLAAAVCAAVLIASSAGGTGGPLTCAARVLSQTPQTAPAGSAGPGAQQPAAAPPPEQPAQAPVPFAEWLEGVRAEALERGIKAETVQQAFDGLQPLPVVVERDRSQAEFTLSLDQYLTRRLTKALVRDTRAALARHRRLLTRVGTKYGVPAHVLASVWAIESNLGRFSGVRPTIQALATLAWEGRRATFFRSELLGALAILDAGDVEPARLKGSWAGALGQPQFMPSTYLRYAQDFDGDGRRDIWGSLPDIFASIANFLKENGWTAGEGWGREVRVPGADGTAISAAAPLRVTGCRAFREMSEPLPLARWSELGVRRTDGEPLPRADRIASLVTAGPRSFLVYGNYEALLAYNCAHAYALSVGVLADRLGR